jgi:ATP-dependent helicase/DNAse subunit B
VWSASQLEEYGRCPFLFFGKRVLGVRELEEPDEDMDRAGEGALLHVCLDRLHTTLAAEFKDAGLTSAVFPRAERLIPTIVERVLGEFEATGRGGIPALRGYRKRALENRIAAYLEWEVKENERTKLRAVPQRRQVVTELAFGFGDSPPVTLHRGARTLRLRGKIDRVDELLDGESAGWRYVVDHKSGDGSLKPVGLYDDGAILQLPLYLHALERAGHAGKGAWGGAYHIVKGSCSRTAAVHPRSLDKSKIREGKTKGEQDGASRLHNAIDQALMHVDGVVEGRFPAALARRATGCAPYCPMRDTCREDRISSGVPGR